MQLKHAVLALAAAGMLSAQAYATEAQVEAAIQPTQPVAAFTEVDMAALFDNAHQPMQLAALSDQEMKETEGALAPLAGLGLWMAGGAVVGGVQHVWRTGSTNGLWRGVGAGATGALYASPFGRTVFAASNFGRWTLGGFGAGSWYRY